MRAVEYGKENESVVILLHGGGLSWWNYMAEAELLKENFHVVLPVLDGHADSGVPFTTIEDNAQRLVGYIDADFGGRVYMIGGVSLGAQILVETLSQRADVCSFALVESALAIKLPLVRALSAPMVGLSYGLMKNERFARAQFKSEHIPEALFEDYCRDSCSIEKQSMLNFMKSNSDYGLKPGLADTTAKTLIAVGGRELKVMLRSAGILHDAIKGSSLRVFEGYGHGELSLNHPGEYVELVKELTADTDKQ